MHFLDAWTVLPPLALLRLLLPAACLALAALVPGRATARLAALGVTAGLPFLRELAVPPLLLAGWVLLWLAIAWLTGRSRAPRAPARTGRLGGLEPGGVGLLAGGALTLLLLAGVARQDLDPDAARRASLGVALIGLALVHLMIRRHALRAAVAFGGLGLGLQMLDSLAREGRVDAPPAGPQLLLASAAAVALTARLSFTRERGAGTAWVSDAHDLHD